MPMKKVNRAVKVVPVIAVYNWLIESQGGYNFANSEEQFISRNH